MDFLVNLNVVRRNDDDSLDVLRVEAAKDIFLEEMRTERAGSTGPSLDAALAVKVIYRREFIQKIFAISYLKTHTLDISILLLKKVKSL